VVLSSLTEIGAGDSAILLDGKRGLFFLLSPFRRRAADEGLREEPIFFTCAPWEASGIQRQEYQLGRRAVSPQPNPLPMGEGDEFSPFSLWERSGDEGLREESIFLICAPWAALHKNSYFVFFRVISWIVWLRILSTRSTKLHEISRSNTKQY
jgi:hypothetical protein